MKRYGVLALFISLTLACVSACVEVIPPSPSLAPAEAPQAAVEPFLRGFSIIPDSEESAVGCLLTEHRELIGSAVLISKWHILTAGHCLDKTEAYWFKTNGKEYHICEQIFHPFYKLNGVLVYDIAMGVLETECEEIPYTLPGVRVLYFQGKLLTAVGYGGGIRKKSDYGTIWYYGTLEESPKYFKMLPTHGTIWFGDSGGALLDSDRVLVGISSSMQARRGILFENSAIRVDRFMEWINLVMKENPRE